MPSKCMTLNSEPVIYLLKLLIRDRLENSSMQAIVMDRACHAVSSVISVRIQAGRCNVLLHDSLMYEVLRPSPYARTENKYLHACMHTCIHANLHHLIRRVRRVLKVRYLRYVGTLGYHLFLIF